MTSGNSDQECHSTQWLINQLTETIGRIDRNDLDELAKMHHWCQALAEACAADNASESRQPGQANRDSVPSTVTEWEKREDVQE